MSRNARAGQDAAPNALLGSQLLVAGSLAGLGNGFISGPVEHIRIRASFPVRGLRFTQASEFRDANTVEYESRLSRPVRRRQEDSFQVRYPRYL